MESLADLAAADWSHLGEPARRNVRFAFADFFGVALSAVRDPAYTVLADYLGRTGAGTVPLPGAPAVGAQHAAIGWGTLAHARDFDDVSEVLHGHPSAVLVPAVLALGHRERASGADLVDAYLSGHEAIGRIAAGAADDQRARGWHTTSTIGVLGAAVAAARILRLSRERTLHALGIATSLASGVQANFGSMTKPLHAGWAAGNGVMAAELAAGGFEAGPRALRADASYLQVYGGRWRPDPAGRTYIDDGIRFKPYPCCGSATGLVDCALRLHAALAAEPPEGGATITAVTCAILPQTDRTLRFRAPGRGDEARFSAEFCVAQALSGGRLTEWCFRDGYAERAAAVRPLMGAVAREIADETLFAPNAKDVAVTVRMSDGRTETATSAAPKGHPANPMSRADLKAKFDGCAQGVLPAAARDAVFDRLAAIDQETSATALLDDVLRHARCAPVGEAPGEEHAHDS
jgi:2-methylcitrate dehydratase PrpD